MSGIGVEPGKSYYPALRNFHACGPLSAAEVRTRKLRACEIGVCEIRVDGVCTAEAGAGRVRATENRAPETRIGKVGAGKVRARPGSHGWRRAWTDITTAVGTVAVAVVAVWVALWTEQRAARQVKDEHERNERFLKEEREHSRAEKIAAAPCGLARPSARTRFEAALGLALQWP